MQRRACATAVYNQAVKVTFFLNWQIYLQQTNLNSHPWVWALATKVGLAVRGISWTRG